MDKTYMAKLHIRADDEGDDEACLLLGLLFYEGDEVPQDSEFAFGYFSEAEKAGNAEAAYYAGLCRYYGHGCFVSDELAYRLFEKAAAGGCKHAKEALKTLEFKEHEVITRAQNGGDKEKFEAGGFYEECFYDNVMGREVYDKAAEWYLSSAKLGNPWAMLAVARLNGDGSDDYYEKAYARFKTLAESGDAEAKGGLACCLLYGNGCETDEAAGKALAKEAADGGCISALFYLARLYDEEGDARRCTDTLESLGNNGDGKIKRKVASFYGTAKSCRDRNKAIFWYIKAAEAGDAYSQDRIADEYASGGAKDEERAFYWYKKAAENGFIAARLGLTECYAEGKGTEKNYAAAVENLKFLVKLTVGLPTERVRDIAAEKIGDCYFAGGYGLERDLQKAATWYRSAALRDVKTAMKKLGDMCFTGIGVKQDLYEAVDLYSRARFYYDDWCDGGCETYDLSANVALGDCYRLGLGADKDGGKAFDCYKDAGEHKFYAPAQSKMAECYYFGIGVKKDLSKAEYWWMAAADKGDTDAKAALKKYFNLGI